MAVQACRLAGWLVYGSGFARQAGRPASRQAGWLAGVRVWPVGRNMARQAGRLAGRLAGWLLYGLWLTVWQGRQANKLLYGPGLKGLWVWLRVHGFGT